MHSRRYTVTIVHHDDAPPSFLSRRRHENAPSIGIARVAQQLDHDILSGADVVDGLAPLGFGAPQTDKAIPEVGLDPEMAIAADIFYKVLERFIGHAERAFTSRCRPRGSRE